MKKRHFILAIAILALAGIVSGAGAHLKYGILKPLDLYQDKSIFELPFLMYSDEYLRFLVEHAEEMKEMEQNPTTVPTKPTQPATDPTRPTESSGTSDVTDSTSDDTQVTEPSDTGTTDSTGSSDTVDTTDSTGESTTTEPTTQPSTSTSSSKEPNFDFPAGVGSDWFDNTLFIGDSRVVGLREYARSGNADYFCDVGMHLLNYDDKTLSDKTFSNYTLEQLLNERQYDKIIVNFGLNECGFNDYSFKMLYRNLLSMLQEKQPDAIIILNGIMSVTKTKADTADYMQPSFIFQRSAFIASLCDGQKVFYIDCNEYFTDENGYLFTSITNDGYHPTASGYSHWRNWMSYAIGQLEL